MKRLLVLVLLLLAGSESSFSQMPRSSPPPSPQTTVDSTIWTRLRRAETFTVVLMRHALAPGTGDPIGFRLGDCATQRNLSTKGRIQAKEIGQTFRRNQVPVARVLSSQWCRCKETARLMNLGKVEQFTALNSFFNNPETESRQTEELRQFMLKRKAERKVVVMVTHQVNITAIAGTIPESGDAVVLQLNEQNRFNVIAELDL